MLYTLVLHVGPVSGADVAASFDLGMDAMLQGDYAEAYCYWRPLADDGHADAQYHVGWLYANGNGLRVNAKQAQAWWKKAAGQSHADAQFALGFALTTGDGVKRDMAQAVNWYLAAARQGHSDARDFVSRLASDPSLRLLQDHPEILREPWFGWRGRIHGQRVNLRSGPGKKHDVVSQVAHGTQVRVVASQGEWLRLILKPHPGTTNGAIWVYDDFVRKDSDLN